jgi:hypothetical protein
VPEGVWLPTASRLPGGSCSRLYVSRVSQGMDWVGCHRASAHQLYQGGVGSPTMPMRQTQHDKATLTPHSAVLPFSPMCSTRFHVSDHSTKPNKVWGVLFICLKAHVLATYFVTAQSGTNLALIPCWPSSVEPSQVNSQDEPATEHGASCDAIQLASPNAPHTEHPYQIWVEPKPSIRVSAYLASTIGVRQGPCLRWAKPHRLSR